MALKTLILGDGSATPPAEAIRRAAEILRAGGLAAFPTETVYGLGANGENPEAVAKIYIAKGRPANNPLILHVPDAESARLRAAEWPREADILVQRFWPGPLTLVLPAGPGIARNALAGGSTVGLRAPDHPAALALLRESGLALAAPSANRSNRISPTSAQAVLDTLDGRIEAVLDGGPCPVGIESTVLDLTGAEPRILRPGGVSSQALSEALGRPVASAGPREGALRSPGLLPRHYSPAIPLELTSATPEPAPDVFLIRLGEEYTETGGAITLPNNPRQYAALLYAALRTAEQSGARLILLQHPPDTPEFEAVNDRLKRARG